MKCRLKKSQGLYYYRDGRKIRGIANYLYGDVSGLSGDVSGLSGDVSGLYGIATNMSGNIDDCELTDEERKNGVDINDLIERGE